MIVPVIFEYVDVSFDTETGKFIVQVGIRQQHYESLELKKMN